MSAERASPERGLVVGMRYRLESVLGEGGMAVVWAAVHTETDRRVALKLVKADFVKDETVRDLFVREARVAARIGKSEYIVDVLDAGVDAALEVPFIAMELLEGQGLDKLIRRGPLPRPLVSDLLEQLAEGLDQAHAAGVFHRDLKPQNLFLTQDRKGRPRLKIVDFGIAKLSESTQQSATHVGTPAYSAPEQLGESWRAIAGRQGKTISARVSAGTDIWAVGLVTFEMLTGAAPGAFWGAKTLAELPVKMVLEPLPSASTRADPALLPLHFDAWMARCLDLDADKRWPTAREAVQALLASLKAAPQPGPAPGSVPPAPGYPSPQGLMQTAADPRILAWITRWRAEVRTPGDARAFLAWPVMYMPRIELVTREARMPLHGALVTIAEVIVSDQLRKAVGEDRMLVAMIQAQRLGYRAAVRSKRSSGGVVDGMSRGLKVLDALLVTPRMGVLGDPHFEQHFEVWAPSPQEAHAAVPVSLRQALVSAGFHGIVERFPGAMLITAFDTLRFDPPSLDRLMDLCGRVLAAIP